MIDDLLWLLGLVRRSYLLKILKQDVKYVERMKEINKNSFDTKELTKWKYYKIFWELNGMTREVVNILDTIERK